MKKEKSDQAKAAAMIKAFCKKQGIPCKASSEQYSMGPSVRVAVEDLAPAKMDELKAYASQFQYGHFDGMQDLYEYSNCKEGVPQAKFVFVENRASEEKRQAIYDYMKANDAGMEGAPEKLDDARLFYNENFCEYADVLIYRLFRGGFNQNRFYDSLAA
jgi:hypothetical protein